MRHPSLLINGLPLLSTYTGIAKYAVEIGSRVRSQEGRFDTHFYYGYPSRAMHIAGDGAGAGSGGIHAVARTLARGNRIKKITRSILVVLSRLQFRTWDLYWELNAVPISTIKCRNLVTTIHDLSFHLHPEWHPAERIAHYRAHFLKNIGRSDRIIAVSHYAKKEIAGELGYSESRIRVIYHGVDRGIFRAYKAGEGAWAGETALPEKFILFVGSIEPRKNLKNALIAYNSLPEYFKREFKFVLAGFSGWNNEDVMSLIRREQENIRYMGYLSERELAVLYNRASVFIYPSLYEGFGLPPVEAMACGTPVIVSNVASLPEICGDAAFYIDPLDSANIAQGIMKVATDDTLRNALVHKGFAKSREYDWDKSAAEHIRLFNEVLGA